MQVITDRNTTKKEIDKMRAEMDNFDPTIGDIENTMRKREKQIDSRVGFLNVNVGSI